MKLSRASDDRWIVASAGQLQFCLGLVRGHPEMTGPKTPREDSAGKLRLLSRRAELSPAVASYRPPHSLPCSPPLLFGRAHQLRATGEVQLVLPLAGML